MEIVCVCVCVTCFFSCFRYHFVLRALSAKGDFRAILQHQKMSFNVYRSKVSQLVAVAQSDITGCHHVHVLESLILTAGRGTLEQDQVQCRVFQAADREGGHGPEEVEGDVNLTVTRSHWHAHLLG